MPEKIQKALNSFSSGNLTENALNLFLTLGYESERRLPFANKSFNDFEEYISEDSRFIADNALTSEWRYVDMLFQLTESELRVQNLLFDSDKSIDQRITSYLFFVIELTEANYSRTKLSQITREVNKPFQIPVLVLFKYGDFLTLSIIDRRPNRHDEAKDVLRKVTLIKDINFYHTHPAHRLILRDLSLDEIKNQHSFQLASFLDLHNAWQKVLDTKELNKKFFQELANWYFWAVEEVIFPDDQEKDREIRNATNVIRLITRLMFVWFLKEKRLVSERLFDEKYLKTILRFQDVSTFYKAVLQNLFFATLNTPMKTRKFRERGFHGKSRHYGILNVFRYEREFITPEETVRDLFDPIPFLNGGLFECLDRPEDKIRVDGYSDHKDSALVVPDDLFFGAEHEIDLNATFGTTNKRYKVRGLINLLNNYKFTVAENTPIEEEVALDPELLGKVFENLLANYNPETKATARKQTGSFYTPREIVNYMVDESLIAYLKRKLQLETQGFGGYLAFGEDQPTMFGNETRSQQKFETALGSNRWYGKGEELEAVLRDLFSYREDSHHFNEIETEILLKAIDNCKILDPACGSGAFPMGILHRLVNLLNKLDPENQKWRQWQKQKAIDETAKAYDIGDGKSRTDRLLEINNIFENNATDYGRKLFLIENCIYGVDIQPIAIQIAKLRFFISLIVDEKTNPEMENLGILPLPNLETKFVAANALVGLEIKGGLKPPEVNDLEKELMVVRTKHFGARTRKTKQQHRDEDKRIRVRIAELLEMAGFAGAAAKQIAVWDPYDQSASASWFDAEYMFGLPKGFDIVIGNPPYVQVQKLRDYALSPTETGKKALESQGYKTFSLTGDIYCLFYEKAWGLIKKNALLAFITPNTWLQSITFGKVRVFLTNRFQWNRILITDKIFDAVVDTHSVIFQKSDVNDVKCLIYTKNNENIVFSHEMETLNIPKNGDSININRRTQDVDLYKKIMRTHRTLKMYCDVFNGVKPFEKGKGHPPQTAETLRTKPFVAEGAKPDESWKPLLRGRLIHRYANFWNENYWILYGPWLAAPRDPEIFSAQEKIVVRQTGDSLISTIIGSGVICRNNLHVVLRKEKIDLLFLLAIINSKVMDFIYSIMNPEKGEALAEVKKTHVESLPIPLPPPEQQAELSKIVGMVLEIKKKHPSASTQDLEDRIDQLVYQFYELTREEILLVEGKV